MSASEPCVLEGSSLLNWLNWQSRFWAVGPGLSETLFDAGRCRATTEGARAGYDVAVASYRQTVLDAFQQVEDNLVVLRVLSTESTQQQQATSAAEESLRIFQNRYAGGVDTYLYFDRGANDNVQQETDAIHQENLGTLRVQ